MESSVCLELTNITKKFGAVTAVDNVDLQIYAGEIFSLLGPSGCGKTTLLRIVAGLETVDQGQVLIDNSVVNNVPPYRRDCSIVFQQLALFPHLTVTKNIAFGLERRKLPIEEINTRIAEMLKLMRLEGLENRRPQQLSGGQQQRVALARSLVLKPKILLLDEPLASLDRKLRKEMQIELRRVQKKVKTTFLYVTHDQKVALSLSDRIGIMHNGEVIQIGKARDIYEYPRKAFVASFMGAVNLFYGKVTDVRDGKVQLDTRDGIMVFAKERDDMRREDITGVAVHPEVIEVIEKKAQIQAANVFEGRIREIFYQGDFVEMTVELEGSGQLMTVHQNKRAGHELSCYPDQEVQIHWDEHFSILLIG
jgi:spermidine/putrescine ABC transporter ATP-binding subunit